MVRARFPFKTKQPWKELNKNSGYRCDGIGAGWYEDAIRDSEIANDKDEELNDSTLTTIKSNPT